MSQRPWHAPPRYLFRRYNVVNEVRKLDINSFIDVGCGAGDLACYLVKELGLKGVGVDFNEEAITKANQLKISYELDRQPIFQQLNEQQLTKLKLADAVFCMEVMEHVKDDKKLLEDLVKLSNKYVVISVPAKKKLFTTSDRLAGHYRRYEMRQLIDMLRQNELEVCYFAAYGYPFTAILRWIREIVAFAVKHRDGSASMENRSKKSGTDLLGVNKYFVDWLPVVIWPFYQFSRLFNQTNLSEGYLVIAQKIATRR